MKIKIQPHSFFVSRTPLLPYSYGEGLSSEKLQQLYQNPVLQEALFIASPELYEVFIQWQRGTLTDPKGIEKLEMTLTKYLLRMTYRCTPFGLFAGISTGSIAETAQLSIADRTHYRRQNRLDMDYLCALAQELGRKPHIRSQLRYFPNTTLYPMGQQLRYAEYKVHKKIRSHHLVDIQDSVYVQKLLKTAQRGATLAELAEALCSDEVSLEEAERFLEEVIDSQLLVSELEPILTGKDYSRHLIEVLESKTEFIPETLLLRNILRTLEEMQEKPLGNNVATYQQLAQQLTTLGVEFELGQLFQVDMYKPAPEHTLPTTVTDELRKAIEVLYQLNPSHDPDALTEFKQAFSERYEGREVPLNEVMDAETGIGYPVASAHSSDHSPLLAEIALGHDEAASSSYIVSGWKRFLMQRYMQAIQTAQTEICLTEADLQPFLSLPSRSLPTSFYSIFSVLAAGTDALQAGDFQIVHRSTAGPSVGNLLGRFCYLDATLTQQVQQALQTEQDTYPAACLAEIVHLNQARIGNIAIRPVLRAYEIPILVQAGVDEDHTLPLEDLRLSIQQNRLVLRSKKLNREVVPRMSNAHNYVLRALPYYHFLCDLQYQNLHSGVRWDWGVLQQASFLPRVSYGKVILSRAKWVLSETDIQTLASASLEQVAVLRTQNRLPRFVTLADGDNELPLDLEDPWSIRLLQELSRKRKHLTLEENPFHAQNLCVHNAEGAFTNEIIIPWQHSPEISLPEKTARPSVTRVDASTVTRSFNLGSEWLYVKVYCGIKTADKLLTEAVYPLVRELLAEGTIDSWFFIRYNDPSMHLRLRFHGEGTFYGRVIEKLHVVLQPYTNSGLIKTIQADTYQRELERYGFQTITEAEHLFFHDSIAVARLLSLLDGDAGDSIRWQMALRGIDQLLTDAGLTLTEKHTLLERLQGSFKKEFNATATDARKSLASKYRTHRPQIEAALQPTYAPTDELAIAWQLLDERSHHWRPVLGTLHQKHQQGIAEVPLMDLLSSYIHMFVNRFFRSRQRMHELVLYDFLYQYYTSARARNK